MAMMVHAAWGWAAQPAQPSVPPSASPQAPKVWRHYPRVPTAPAGAPNVLLVLTDDVGFGASSTFGGPIPTPTFDTLAAMGLRYTQFHTTAMCSPTRAALLTGRNHHAVGSGSIADVSVDEAGYTSVMPASAATLGRVLHGNGYNTAFFGKNHNTPPWEGGPMGPFEHWPNGMGFDYFYGFNAAATDQFNPDLIENRNPVRRDPADSSYHFDRDLADHMLSWLRSQHAVQPDKPFFLYYAPGAMHDPQQAPQAWIERFRGQFDGGWDAMREQTFARQKAMGLIPASAQLPAMPAGVPRWNSLSADQKRLYARMMEVAAAQLAYMDDQFGRVIAHLRESGQLDNTLVIFIQGDNGAALHTYAGSINAYATFAGIQENDADTMPRLNEIGSENTFGNYPVGWALATNTPYPWGKTVASQLGGLRDGMVISWPRRIRDRGAMRSQFGHVIDIAPTIYQAIGITPPAQVDGVRQQPIDGISLTYTFDHPSAPSRHREQYFEMLGSRAYYRDGWLAGTAVNWNPWEPNHTNPMQTPWELYDLRSDPTQTRNVAAQFPAKLAQLRAAFDVAARRNHVYPLSADFFARINPHLRPAGLGAARSRTYYPGETRLPAQQWPDLVPGWQARVSLNVAAGAASGPVFAQGTRFAGYGLALENGVPVFTYNPTGREQERRILRAPAALAPGSHVLEVAFAPATQGAQIRLSVDGTVVATQETPRVIRIMAGQAFVGQPAIDDRSGPRACGCTIAHVTIATP
ncbi:sulfatase-like hydrolase/transferase [Novosphingobium sp. FSY-8]|uniref:Sulfatase-like hydrolase/transferase n=2 Tax=Novosphingobium ovatum TaxID=1908523 RepID=A0ABW9XG74_9SPHN|nr:sulfatase-like hydrolase/transferase [Novosphingobium ovatum]